jgi:lipopolysaccharide transport system ATP-binding protein
VGIIGRNGAGKSTLLKILSRITEPSTGRVTIKGRVSSLLEVGTGFHPELSGRENIYLNGTILGMTRVEIKHKFDEIVAFAEVEKYLDTPVKRYSSGMYVRLAFAVAAHLEPEILLIDEVLAVGDAAFQKKCLGKMGEVAEEGRTVLFVSHNMSAIQSLCKKAILIKEGKVNQYDETGRVIHRYLDESIDVSKNVLLAERKDRTGSGQVRVVDFKTKNHENKDVGFLQSGNSYSFQIKYFNRSGSDLNNVVVSLDFFDEINNRVLLFRTNFTNSNLSLNQHYGYINCHVNNLPLANAIYRTSIFISQSDAEILDYITDASLITVDGGDFFGTGSSGLPGHCKILHLAEWSSQSKLTDN